VEAARGSDQAQVGVTVGMQPPSASNSVQVTYRVNGGTPATVAAALLTHDPHQQAQYFRAQLPTFRVGDNVEYLVVGRAPGHQVPGLEQAGQFAASFRVVPDPPPEGASALLHAAAPGRCRANARYEDAWHRDGHLSSSTRATTQPTQQSMVDVRRLVRSPPSRRISRCGRNDMDGNPDASTGHNASNDRNNRN
jgi:hypothetical protein